MNLFNIYYSSFGQKVNNSTSFIFSGSLPQARLIQITNITGFSKGSFPFMYLGVLIFKRKDKAIHLRPIAGKVIQKLAA